MTIIGLDVLFVWLLLNPRPFSGSHCLRQSTGNFDFNQRNLLKLTHFLSLSGLFKLKPPYSYVGQRFVISA